MKKPKRKQHRVLVTPTAPRADGAIAVVLIPESRRELVALNGMPLAPGLYAMRHGDRLDIGGRPFWVSAQASAEEVPYVPALHGEVAYCLLTKARIRPGQEIRICPGVPGSPCRELYKADAWALAMQASPRLKCPTCGYRPGQAEWEPPPPRQRRTLDGLLPRNKS